MRVMTTFAAALACASLVCSSLGFGQTTNSTAAHKTPAKSATKTETASKTSSPKAGAASTKSPAASTKSVSTKASSGRPASVAPKAASTASSKAGVKTTAHPAAPITASAKASPKRGTTSAKTTTHAATHSTPHVTPHYTQQQPTPDRYREIQQALADKGYFHGTVDGEWGTDSADALKRFQIDQNLDPDGKIGALSLIGLGLGPRRESAAAKPITPDSSERLADPAPEPPAESAAPSPAP